MICAASERSRGLRGHGDLADTLSAQGDTAPALQEHIAGRCCFVRRRRRTGEVCPTNAGYSFFCTLSIFEPMPIHVMCSGRNGIEAPFDTHLIITPSITHI